LETPFVRRHQNVQVRPAPDGWSGGRRRRGRRRGYGIGELQRRSKRVNRDGAWAEASRFAGSHHAAIVPTILEPGFAELMDQTREPIRVLVVDDERSVADSLAMILRTKQYDATAAYSAEEAVQLCQAVDPHIVISDIVMGPMSGFDLAIWLAEHLRACRIILMSAHSFHEPLVARSVRHGFDFLPKPIHPDKLLAKLAAPGVELESSAEPLEETKASEE
jgi:CheY-like chemotaxis protein